jgi:RNA polymerase sigma-70 factor (ECF subfamily)
MTADSQTTSEAAKDPITTALEDGRVKERLLAAARSFLGQRAYSLSATQRQAKAEEIVSNTIEKVWERRRDYKPDRDVVSWMVGFVSNITCEHLKKNARSPTGPPLEAPGLEDLAVDLFRKESDKVDDKDQVDRLLKQLNADEKQLIEMKYFKDMTFEEIAEQMNSNENAVRVKHHRLISRLRRECCASGEVQS